MGKKSIKSAAAAAKATSARRKAEIEMVNAIGANLNQMVETICSAAVESRRIDFEGLESSDKAAVLMAEGTTLVALVQSNNEALASMWQTMAPMASAFLGQMAQVQAVRAQARDTEAQASLLTAQTRAEEAKVKAANAETERIKAQAARKARYEAASAAAAAAKARSADNGVNSNGVDVNEVW